MKLALQIAITHLLSKKKQTLVAMLGVTFGIAMFIVMISFMTGVNDFLEDSMLASSPHIRVYKDITAERKSVLEEYYGNSNKQLVVVHHQKPKAEKLNLKSGLQLQEILNSDDRISGTSAQVSSQVFYNYGPVQINGIISGVDIQAEDKLFNLRKRIKSGKMENLLTTTDGILMGSGLAKKLNVKTGDRINVSTPLGGTLVVKVVGIFAYGVGAIDNVKSYATMNTAQKLLGKDSRYITEINMKLVDLNVADILAKEYEAKTGFKAEDWKTANSTILVSFTIRGVLTVVVSATLLIVAGFGIYNIMNMTINNKMKDIAILKATGFASGDILKIFISQSVIIGFFGALMGLILGFLLSYGLSTLPFDAGEFLDMKTFPVNFNPKYYLFGIVFGIITTILAGFFPSRRAGRIDPVAILRG